jgi:membrane protease YdiL (CAAX protease family)
MREENQAAPPADPPRDPPPTTTGIEAALAGGGAPPPVPDDPVARRARRGLAAWAAILVVAGLGSLATGQTETAGLVAIAGLFAAAHAADLDPQWRRAYALLALVPPLGGAIVFAALAYSLAHGDLGRVARIVGVATALLGAVGTLASGVPGPRDALVRRFFRGGEPTHALRLAAQLVLAGLLLAVPGWFAFAAVRETLAESGGPLLGKPQLISGLLGYILLALGGVGCGVKRSLAESRDRLGIAPLRPRDLAVIVLGIAFLAVLNGGAEALQRHYLPALWKLDSAISKLIARDLTPAHIVLLGLSAGIGEEIVLRGALQPRLGITLTALVFAALHVQYSWFGMALVFALGLALGHIRRRTSTGVAMTVHGLYDMLAVFAS